MNAHASRRPEARLPAIDAPRVSLLGGEVDVVTSHQLLDFAQARIDAGYGAIIANHNLHSLHLVRRDAEMAAFYGIADLIEVDSTPLIAWGQLLRQPLDRSHRVTYLDWRELFWRRACDHGWRVFYLGGAPGVAAKGADAIRARWPTAEIAVRDGYFDMDNVVEADAVAGAVAQWRPDILFVGMGMPRQERWILRHRARLPRSVIFSVGAAFDYEAGIVPTPPRWTGRLGMEWLYRFTTEPKRLFTRYFIEPWSLIGPALADLRRD